MDRGKSVTGRYLHATLGSIITAVVLACSTVGGGAHEGVVHQSDEEAARHLREQENTPGFPSIKGGDFKLIDQFGAERTSKDPDNRFQLLFFGYAKCKAICSVALPRMGEVADRLEAEGMRVTPLLITVDPERDTVAALAEAAPKYHSRLIGLTGSQQALDEAYRAFQIERSIVFVDPEQGAVYAHGSYIYLIGPDGAFKTLFPPILSPERIAELVRQYVHGNKS